MYRIINKRSQEFTETTYMMFDYNCMKALSYTPEEVKSKIIKRKASRDIICCECHIYKNCNEWYDNESKLVFCDECALKYGWRKEQPIDFLIHTIGRRFLYLKERNYHFDNFGSREMIFAQIPRYIHTKDYYRQLVELRCSINDTKEDTLTTWLEDFKKTHNTICNMAQYDCESNYIVLIHLLNNFPIDLYLEPELEQELEPEQPKKTNKKKTNKKKTNKRYHPYNNNSQPNTTSAKSKYINILNDIKNMCLKGLEIYHNEWKNDPEEYFKILNKNFPLEVDDQ
jgi:hypothetical protein